MTVCKWCRDPLPSNAYPSTKYHPDCKREATNDRARRANQLKAGLAGWPYNREAHTKATRAWRKRNPVKARDASREQGRRYRENNPDKCRDYNREWMRRYRERKRVMKAVRVVLEDLEGTLLGFNEEAFVTALNRMASAGMLLTMAVVRPAEVETEQRGVVFELRMPGAPEKVFGTTADPDVYLVAVCVDWEGADLVRRRIAAALDAIAAEQPAPGTLPH